MGKVVKRAYKYRFYPTGKTDWYGRDLRLVDRWYPSSKICSACGALQATMPLNVRTWACPCGQVHDRDVNAARSLLAAGLVER